MSEFDETTTNCKKLDIGKCKNRYVKDKKGKTKNCNLEGDLCINTSVCEEQEIEGFSLF